MIGIGENVAVRALAAVTLTLVCACLASVRAAENPLNVEPLHDLEAVEVTCEILREEGGPVMETRELQLSRAFDDRSVFRTQDAQVQVRADVLYRLYWYIEGAPKRPASGLVPLAAETRLDRLGLTTREAKRKFQRIMIRGLTIADVRAPEQPVLIEDVSQGLPDLVLKYRPQGTPDPAVAITVAFRFVGADRAVLQHRGYVRTAPRWTWVSREAKEPVEFVDDFTLTTEVDAFLRRFGPSFQFRRMDMNALRCDILAVDVRQLGEKVQTYCTLYQHLRESPAIHVYFKYFDLASFPLFDPAEKPDPPTARPYDLFLERTANPDVWVHLLPTTRDGVRYTGVPPFLKVTELVDRLRDEPMFQKACSDSKAQATVDLTEGEIPAKVDVRFESSGAFTLHTQFDQDQGVFFILALRAFAPPAFLKTEGVSIEQEELVRGRERVTRYLMTAPEGMAWIFEGSGPPTLQESAEAVAGPQ